MSEVARGVAAARQVAALFELPGRAVVEVSGGDRERWLDGMVSNQIVGLSPEGPRSGCYATLLTPKGRIVADLHVIARPDHYWLDVDAAARDAVLERLDRYLIADDVTLTGRDDVARIGIEGPRSADWLAAAGVDGEPPPADGAREVELAGVPVVVATYGWSGEPALQLFVPADRAGAVLAALRERAPEGGEPAAGAEALEVLRIEAGVPRLFAELDEEVFPAEARLDARAVSTTKGCYTGQEIVARLRSRGHVNHLLVGLRFEGEPPAVDTDLYADGKRTGEVTSVCRSPAAGPIGLGYVRVQHAEPGTALRAGEATAIVEAPGAARRDGAA